MEDRYAKRIQAQFGRRRGSLWRSERDWYAGNFDPLTGKGTSKQEMNIVAQLAKEKRHGLYNEKGWSTGRMFKYRGMLPYHILLCHPELWHDDNELEKFIKEYHAFGPKGAA